MDRSTLKPSETHSNLHTVNDNISQLNIEEAIINIPRQYYHYHYHLSHRVKRDNIRKTQIQLKEYTARIHETYALRNTQGFEKELDRPKVTKIMEVTSAPQNSKAFWPKGKCTIIGDSTVSGLKKYYSQRIVQ